MMVDPQQLVVTDELQKPMFQLKPADGAIGSHMDAVRRCYEDIRALAAEVMARAEGAS